ncbi:MAG: hypothetical protein U0S50_15880 [Sphingopyxis sp.]|uniref:hypothetical protein n=1 Tax=Sphingopyxis sp. TaxID=1908224 RepID=UPI002ABCFBB1|nr:hypothetical protein [Sphingopyxis sp.]MDZ3833276.1 hypothetical protein [Sphingopyxis sp.]
MNIGVGGKSVRLELPPGSGHEVVADVRPADAPSEQGVTLLFYAGNSDAPIATPTLYPPDKPAAFLIRVPPGTRWLRVEAKPLTDGKTSQTVDHGNAPVLGIALRTPE